MKRLIFGAMMFFAVSYGYVSYAQTEVKDTLQLSHKRMPREGKGARIFNPEKMAERRAEAMAKELDLSNKQKEKVLALLKEDMKDRGLMNGQPGKKTKEERQAQKERREKFDKSLKKILTSKQYEKYSSRKKYRVGPQRMPQPPREQQVDNMEL